MPVHLPEWAHAHGGPICPATLREEPSDFVVEEILGFDPAGDGEHDLLHIRKTDANTAWVGRQLARHAGIPEVDVGYAGLKDRRAVTSQWFSVRRPNRDGTDWSSFSAAGVKLLAVERHDRKLRRGAHTGNRFLLTLRLGLGPETGLLERVDKIAADGVPNYFGEQRFGHDGGNVDKAHAVLGGRRVRRAERGIAISAARAWIFNAILDARVSAGTWNRLLDGERANLDGSGSTFAVDTVDEELAARCAAGDIHPTATLWGDAAPLGERSVAAFEHETIAAGDEHTQGFAAGLENARIEPASRALRLPVRELEADCGDGVLRLRFRLGKGGYATAVVREIIAAQRSLSST